MGLIYGSGSGDGDGSGYKLVIPFKNAFFAYHYIKKENDKYVLRNGAYIEKGEKLHEEEIELCKCGFHSSFTKEDARVYRPSDYSVLTKVLVWGSVIIGEDKIVSTDRMIIEEL